MQKRMIAITEEGYTLCSEGVTATDFSGICLNAMLGVYRDIISQQDTEEEKKKCAEELYDMFNIQASAFLDELIPEKELRPDLDEQAILKAQNEILDNVTLEAIPTADA